MKLCLAAVATATVALVAPAAASAATLTVDPVKPCYGSGETVNLLGAGFTPSNSVNVSKGAESVGSLNTDAAGAFNGQLTLGQRNGRETRTYTATDAAVPTTTAAVPITVNELDVGIKPKSGAPGRKVTISAEGFTNGNRLWAHVVRGKYKRNLRLGTLKKACHVLKKKRRLLPASAELGVYIVQFDTARKYEARRPMSVGFSITVRRVFRPAAAAAAASPAVTWNRLY